MLIQNTPVHTPIGWGSYTGKPEGSQNKNQIMFCGGAGWVAISSVRTKIINAVVTVTRKMIINHKLERKWPCAFPGCKVKFSSLHEPDDRLYCKKHREERRVVYAKLRYHFKKNASKYYKKKRVNSLKYQLKKAEAQEKDAVKLLSIVRSKMTVLLFQLDQLSNEGFR